MMDSFLRGFQFDRNSFWLGFLAASLFWWLLIKLLPGLRQLFTQVRARIQEARQEIIAPTDVHLRNDLLRHVQGLHLAAPLFALDEIGLPARFLAPPLPPGIRHLAATDPPIHQAIPYMPDTTEMGSAYQAASLTLAEALEPGMHLLATGPLGSGKTVALAQLAISVARQEISARGEEGFLPLWLHAAWLALPLKEEETFLQRLERALQAYTTSRTQSRLAQYLPEQLAKRNTLVFIDGFDELSPSEIDRATDLVRTLIAAYPRVRIVASAHSAYYGKLAGHGFMPLGICAWDVHQRARFLERWTQLWQQYVGPEAGALENSESSLLNAWITNQVERWSPLSYTLLVWAVYAGDLTGASDHALLEAYLRRMLVSPEGEQNKTARTSVQSLALQQVLSGAPFAHQETTPEDQEPAQPDTEETSVDLQPSSPGEIARLQKSKDWHDVERSGLVTGYGNGLWRINHPSVCAYLAASELIAQADPEPRFNAAWLDHRAQLQLQVGGYWALLHPEPEAVIDQFLSVDKAPFHANSLAAGSWLQNLVTLPAWGTKVLRRLAGIVRDESLPISVRCKAVTVLVIASPPGLATLLHQMLASHQPVLRQITALACGLTRNAINLEDLIAMLADPNPDVERAAALALAVHGAPRGLDALAESMLHGSETQRHLASQALALHPEEGHPALKEGSAFEDLLVRRAVVPGLAMIKQPWARQLLETMVVEDPQWVVKNAAQQALEAFNAPPAYFAGPHPPLDETPWLVAFAGQKEQVLSKGPAAMGMLLEALNSDSEEHQLEALNSIQALGLLHATTPVWRLFEHSQGGVREVAYQTLLRLQAGGAELPL